MVEIGFWGFESPRSVDFPGIGSWLSGADQSPWVWLASWEEASQDQRGWVCQAHVDTALFFLSVHPPLALFWENITVHLSLKRGRVACQLCCPKRGLGTLVAMCFCRHTVESSLVGSWCGARASAFLEPTSPSVRWACCCLLHLLPGHQRFCFLFLSIKAR